jgi:hypothetical protein
MLGICWLPLYYSSLLNLIIPVALYEECKVMNFLVVLFYAVLYFLPG